MNPKNKNFRDWYFKTFNKDQLQEYKELYYKDL